MKEKDDKKFIIQNINTNQSNRIEIILPKSKVKKIFVRKGLILFVHREFKYVSDTQQIREFKTYAVTEIKSGFNIDHGQNSVIECIKYAWLRIKNRSVKDIQKTVKKQTKFINSLPVDKRFGWNKTTKQFEEI